MLEGMLEGIGACRGHCWVQFPGATGILPPMQGREPQESQRQKTTYCQEIGPITSLHVQEAMAGIQAPPHQMQTR